MFKRLFGRGSDKPGASGQGVSIDNKMPWEPDERAAADAAISNLMTYLMADLTGPRGVHIETLLTIVGALAGFAAQHAIRETIVKPGKLPEHGEGQNFDDGAFVPVTAQTGEKFYFGDLLNSYLVQTGGKLAAMGPGRYTLLGFVSAAVIQCGCTPLAEKDVQEIFSNAAATIGTALFGEPRLPKAHRPAMEPRRALNRAWPMVRVILATPNGLSVRHWPALIGLVAQKFIVQAKSVIDPALAMRIVFEAAIPMSKIDPATVSTDAGGRLH